MILGRRGARRPDDWPSAHVRARADLSEQLDGALDPSETEWLHDHLAGCAECRATADAYAAQRLELRALRDRPPLPPRELWARTAAAIETEAAGRSRTFGRNPRRYLLLPSAFIATALVVAVAVGTLTSSQRFGGGGNLGSSGGVAAASTAPSSTPGDVAFGGGGGGPTPIPVRKEVEYFARDATGKLVLSTKKVVQVCPEGSVEPCDTSTPVQETSVTVDKDAQAVFGSSDKQRLIVVSSPTTDDPGSVSVVALADQLGPDRSNAPSTAPSASPSASPSPAPTPSPSVTPSPIPPSVPASPTPTPTVTATPTGSIDVTPPGSEGTVEIAHGVILVGQTAAYSSSGSWFAFTARPIDATSGPDIYLWRVGTAAAQRVTDDGRSVFGSWVGDQVVGSTALDRQGGDGTATSGLRPGSFLLDPETGTRTELLATGSAWRPAVNPAIRKAVYWTGTLRTVTGPGFAPDAGRLVLGDWDVTAPIASGSPEATALAGDQANARHETTIAAGRMDDWDARWDQSGTHLAVWIADHENPAIGHLSLYSVSHFDGTIDLKTPLLDAERAVAGFSISDDGLIWAAPSDDPSSSDGTIQLLAWTDSGVGKVETLSGPALVIR